MPRIKPRTRGKHFVRYTTRLERENHETLYAYGQFIGESPEYIVNELVETLAKDREFLAWRGEHPHSFVPRAPDQPRRVAKRAAPASSRAADDALAATPMVTSRP